MSDFAFVRQIKLRRDRAAAANGRAGGRSYRSVTAATLAIVLSALAGGVFGHSALATEDRIPDHYKTFTAALSAIQTTYAESVETDRLVYGAINGMLQTLDPHS